MGFATRGIVTGVILEDGGGGRLRLVGQGWQVAAALLDERLQNRDAPEAARLSTASSLPAEGARSGYSSPRSPAYSSAIYNLAVAAVLPALLIVLAFTKARGMTRLGLLVAAPVMFVVICSCRSSSSATAATDLEAVVSSPVVRRPSPGRVMPRARVSARTQEVSGRLAPGQAGGI